MSDPQKMTDIQPRQFDVPRCGYSDAEAAANGTRYSPIGDSVNVQLSTATCNPSGVIRSVYFSNGFPSGLSFDGDRDSRRYTGTVSGAQRLYTVTYYVEPPRPHIFPKTFKWFVYDDDLIDDLGSTVGDTVDVLFPTGIGTGSLVYSMAGRLPDGLRFSASTRRVTGVVSGNPQTYPLSYTVRDTDGDSYSVTFDWVTTRSQLRPSAPNLSNRENNRGDEIDEIVRAGTGGDPPLTYTLTNFPLGLSFNSQTRRLFGIISAQARTDRPYEVRYTVRDSDGDSDPETFFWTILDSAPTAPFIANRASLVGDMPDFIIDEGTGGDPPLFYSIPDGQLPPGVTFNPVTRRVSGTITGERDIYTITLTVMDNDGTAATRTFTWSVTLGDPMAPTVGNLANVVGGSIDIILPEGVGGDPPLSYTLTGDPRLPPGVAFVPATRRLHGTVLGVEQTYTMTYTVFDRDAQSHSVVFLWNVQNPDLFPTAPVLLSRFNRVGDVIFIFLPAGFGGNPPLSYTLIGLPDGLRFDSGTRLVGGTITGSANVYIVELTVTDEDGDSDVATQEWEVAEPDTNPRIPDIIDKTGGLGDMVNEVLPQAASGNPPYSYRVEGLPPGLVFDPQTRRVTGTLE